MRNKEIRALEIREKKSLPKTPDADEKKKAPPSSESGRGIPAAMSYKLREYGGDGPREER